MWILFSVESALAELDSLPDGDGAEDRDYSASPDNWNYNNTETLKKVSNALHGK